MTSLVNEALLAVSRSLPASIVVKATVTTAVGLLGARLARKSRAAMRHAVLAATFGVLLLLPIAAIVAPPFRIVVSAEAPQRSAPVRAGFALTVPAASLTRANVDNGPVVSRISVSAFFFAVWIVGAMLFLIPVAVSLWQIRSLRRSALPWRQGQSSADALALDAGIHRRVDVLLHESLPGPMTFGIVRPAIVLPRDAETWAEEDVNRAILHELEHVRRGDWVSQCLARCLCAAYWFHPLVWMAWRRLELEAERSCDDAVLRQSEATAYADQLVGLAERFSAGHRSLLAMANRSDLAARVSAVLDGKQTRGRAGRLPLALACTAAAVLVLTMSPLQVVAAPQAAGTSGPSTLPVFSSVTKLVAVPVVVTYQNGTPIDGLGPKDFAVSEDGVEQTLILFEFQQADATRGSLSSQYILGYYPKNRVETTEFRKIEVTLKQYPTAQVRARQGYFARVFTGVPSPSVARTSVANSAASSDATPPVLIRKVEPEYSEAARKGKWQGTVTLDVEVSASGSVSAVTVVRSLGQGLDEKAIEAVQQWKFRPGMKGGKPVAAQTQVEVSFRLL